jgi:hypothetical protein
MSERIENLRTAIETMHKCKAVHEGSDLVIEKFIGKTVWEGIVESFSSTRHSRAKRCHAWSHQEKGEIQYVNVLEIPPVISAETAAKTAIASGSQK